MTLPVSAISKAAEQFAAPRAQGAEWSVGGDPAARGASAPGDPAGSFGSMLTNAIGDLERTQEAAAAQATALATGQTQDLTSVITAVQEAQLSMQLAAQVRNKAVEAYTEIFHTQI
ncbi:MAG TPA: flagellar hook-basal body complex protein FliE [Solirubrobacterales bacterium]|nr:flagellar hook-basal body complex protein FliE [Solirubrobacterales bacterium]